jgi:radical SAM protein with 4Fe4S-binding SPASM domain
MNHRECTGYAVVQKANSPSLWQKSKPLLNSLDLELTERCNNACVHCCINLPQDDVNARARELATDDWKEILQQSAGLGALSVRFSGGEPLLRDDFAELYLFARRLGLSVRIFTNARLVTAELAALLARFPPREKIEVTVYGMRRESYDANACAPGGYDEFRSGVARLMQQRVPFIVKGALLQANRGETEEFESWAAGIPWMEGPPTYSMFFDLRDRRDSKAKNDLIARLRLSPEDGVAVLTRKPEKYRKDMAEFCGKFMRPAGDRLFTCGAGHGGCVDAYGKFHACMGLRVPGLAYDLRSGSLRAALTDFFPRLREMVATNPDYLERCARCFLHGLCEQCPAKSWSEHGSMDTPVEYLCQVAHAQARYLGILNNGEQAWRVSEWQSRVRKFIAETQESPTSANPKEEKAR